MEYILIQIDSREAVPPYIEFTSFLQLRKYITSNYKEVNVGSADMMINETCSAPRKYVIMTEPEFYRQLGNVNGFYYKLVQKVYARMCSAARTPKKVKPECIHLTTKKKKQLEVNGVIFSMVNIPGGTFAMGRPETTLWWAGKDELQHTVTLDDFWMGETPVTQELWAAVMGSNPSVFSECKNRPVDSVSWHNAQEFIERLNGLTSQAFRLPTEAEWEYACKGGETSLAPCYGNIKTLSKRKMAEGTTAVKTFPPNAWGLYDMFGNVEEWCSDWYGSYPSDPSINPIGPDSGEKKVTRGGSWDSAIIDYPTRDSLWPDVAGCYHGFRLAMTEYMPPATNATN